MGDHFAPPPTVLVVDDNEQNRALAQAALEDEGYEVVVVSNGPDAIRVFDEKKPDCLLLDVRMPGMDGFEVCREIRNRPGGADTPVVFLTALRDVDTFDSALRAGGDDFLTKPVRPTELVLRVQAALRLRRLNAENREYVDLIRRQRDDMTRLQLQKERLSAFVVHDLKNPVNTVDLQAQLLLRDPSLSDKARRAVTAIREETRALTRLLLNLLDISKSEEGHLVPNLATVDLSALVTELLEAHSARARAREITLESDLGATSVRADPDLLRRVLENLLENALRHGTEGSKVKISSVERDGGIELRVTDAGPGVPAEMKETIFDRFVQLEGDRAATRSGRGLGLTFCKHAVEAHEGRIWVEDADPGATFCVRLPGGRS
jgi:two-component system sensor histidine kinase/response regulator